MMPQQLKPQQKLFLNLQKHQKKTRQSPKKVDGGSVSSSS